MIESNMAVLYHLLLLTFAAILSRHQISAQLNPTLTGPLGCTGVYDVFDCDVTAVTFPMAISNFRFDIANELYLTGISATWTPTATDFASFTAYNVTAMAIYPVLEIVCNTGGSLVLTATGLTGLEYFSMLRIRNCITTLADDCFAPFTNLTSIAFVGGELATMPSNTFRGLNLEHTGSEWSASINITGTKLLSNTIPIDWFGPVANLLYSIRVTDTNYGTVIADTFWNVTFLHYLDLSRNNFTTIPDNMFDHQKMLHFVIVHGIPWSCECDGATNYWLLDWEFRTRGEVMGELQCSTPADQEGNNLRTWKADNCDKAKVGFFLGTHFVGLFSIIMWTLTLIFMILAIVALVIALKARKTMPKSGSSKKQPPKQPKMPPNMKKPPNKTQPIPAPGPPPDSSAAPPPYKTESTKPPSPTVVAAVITPASKPATPPPKEEPPKEEPQKEEPPPPEPKEELPVKEEIEAPALPPPVDNNPPAVEEPPRHEEPPKQKKKKVLPRYLEPKRANKRVDNSWS